MSETQPAPRLERRGNTWQLIVDGRPFFARAGELQNSSGSSKAYMADIWPKLVRANMNTVLAVVGWDVIEPEEGKFDYEAIDHLIEDARAHNIKLVPLWFGTWKNGASHYVPYWVKADQARFPLVKTQVGNIDTISYLSEEAQRADAKAFAAFMSHIKQVDSDQHTVIMVQVENEVGIVGDARDRSDAAEKLFHAPVPAALSSYLATNKAKLLPEMRTILRDAGDKTAGTWSEMFGNYAPELFSVWHYATFINEIVAAGKAAYDLPMFVNAWLPPERPAGLVPGEYPSGGPVPHAQDIWRAGAPRLDFLAPDIYVSNFAETVELYNRAGNPVFVPEGRSEAEGAANAVYTASIGGFGFSPFAIESRVTDYDNGPLTQAYRLIEEIEPLIFEYQVSGRLKGAIVSTNAIEQRFVMEGHEIQVGLVTKRHGGGYRAEHGYAIVFATGPDEYTIAGANIQVSFASPQPDGYMVGIGWADEGRYVDGRWVKGRRLNGDEIVLNRDLGHRWLENQTGTALRFLSGEPEIQKVKLYRFRR